MSQTLSQPVNQSLSPLLSQPLSDVLNAEPLTPSEASAPVREVRPYGFLGLIISFVGICALGSALMALGAGIWIGIVGLEAVQGAIGRMSRVPINDVRNASHEVQMVFYGVTAASFVGFGLATLAFARLRGGKDWRIPLAWNEAAGWPSRRGQIVLAVCALAYLVVAGFGIKLIYPQFQTWFFVPTTAGGLVLSFVTVVILAPLAEELIFRGWIYTSLRQSFGAWPAIAITAAVFALVHMDPTRLYPLLIFVPGLMFTIIREKNGSARASFYAHAAYNFLAWIIVLTVGNS